MFNYQATIERRIGPFGIWKEKTPKGELDKGRDINFKIGGSEVSVALYEDHTIRIELGYPSSPVIVEFAAERLRSRPKIASRLHHEGNPGIISGRRKITIYSENDPSQRLVLKAPKFQPRLVTATEARELMDKEIGR